MTETRPQDINQALDNLLREWGDATAETTSPLGADRMREVYEGHVLASVERWLHRSRRERERRP